jgi:hypothetical protein
VLNISSNEKYVCMVCEKPTNDLRSSPFNPYTGPKCTDCTKAHLIPYVELLIVFTSADTDRCYQDRLQSFREWWKGSDEKGPDTGVAYAEKYWLPTLAFYGKTAKEVWEEANKRKSKPWAARCFKCKHIRANDEMWWEEHITIGGTGLGTVVIKSTEI